MSTQLRHAVRDFDDFIGPEHADFATSGIKAPSIIRLGFLAVLPSSSFSGAIGSVASERHQRLLAQLCQHLKPKETA